MPFTGPRMVAVVLLTVLAMITSWPDVATAGAQTPHASTAPTYGPLSAQASSDKVLGVDVEGNAVDAHDGEIQQFGSTYYLYGTSYGCGYYRFSKRPTPFCGFKVYSSPDLATWTDHGFLFDPADPVWQQRCNSLTLSCYRPHVVFNATTQRYVLWINAYDVPNGYHVFTAGSPIGPFQEVGLPTLATTGGGDMDIFVDTDGTGYIATTLRPGYRMGVERLDPTYTTGTGEGVELPLAKVEAPSLFRRGATYYMTISQPGCAYCGGTGTSVMTAPTPLGPWTAPVQISADSCGGQPADVAQITYQGQTGYLYQSDRWNHRRPNQGLAGHHWELLSFDDSGAVKPLQCPAPATRIGAAAQPPDWLQGFTTAVGWHGSANWECRVRKGRRIAQVIVPQKSGRIEELATVLFRERMYGGHLTVALHQVKKGRPIGQALWKRRLPAQRLAWAPEVVRLQPDITARRGRPLALVLSTTAKGPGCFGSFTRQSTGGASTVRRWVGSGDWTRLGGAMPVALRQG